MVLRTSAWVLGAAGLAACASMSNDAETTGARGAFPGDPAENSSPGANAGAPGDGGIPERELESLYEAPVATGRYVWVANPRSGRVALVDVVTLSVKTVEAGNEPTTIAALPPACAAPCEDDRVLVLNVRSKDATLIKAGDGSGGGASVSTIAVPSGGNRWTVSSDGRHAIAWTDAKKVIRPDKTQGFQDLTIVDLSLGTSTVLAVGYRPVAIGFAAATGAAPLGSASARAFAVTQDGISVVDLAPTPHVAKNVAISDDPTEDPGSRDVSLTPDGAYALIRREGVNEVTIVSLVDGVRQNVKLDGPVTDLDLSPNGDRAVAVVKTTATAFVLPLPQIFAAPQTFTKVALPGETIGSIAIAPTGARGLLYTTEAAIERVSVLELSPLSARTVRLYSPVLASFLSPDAAFAVVLHQSSAAAAGAGQTGAFSLVPIGADLPAKIVATGAPPMNVAFSPASDRGIVTERDDRTKTYGAYLASFPLLGVTRYPLASPPIAAGIAARAQRAYVAQEHPEGRITFIDFATGQARTLTGFELAARVADGSQGN